MRYSLLTYLRCPVCRGALACYGAREVATPICPFVAVRAERAPDAGHAFAPSPPFVARTPLTKRLTDLAGPAAPDRNRTVAVDAGLLICGECARWFPILDGLPELLPDHLRDAAREAPLLASLGAGLPEDLRAMLRDPAAAAGTPADDHGAHYKRAEIGITSKITDQTFFGPGYSSPFNPANTDFTLYLIKLFANVITLLDVKQGGVVVDSGSGYAWTTEWLAKSGLEAIGVDISRIYPEVGIHRMGASRPHLIVADVENLPIADGCADAVLAFESFHHLPDRPRAMAGYARVLKNGGSVVLAEPGAGHEEAEVSVDTMAKYGILEKGMEIDDVDGYVEGLPFAPPEQHYVLHASTTDLERGIFMPAARRHTLFHGNLFRITKDASRVAPPASRAPRMHTSVPPVVTSIDELTAHARLTREWNAELERADAELRKVTADLALAKQTIAAIQTSAFWKVRQVWVRIAALFGSHRGELPSPPEIPPAESDRGPHA